MCTSWGTAATLSPLNLFGSPQTVPWHAGVSRVPGTWPLGGPLPTAEGAGRRAGPHRAPPALSEPRPGCGARPALGLGLPSGPGRSLPADPAPAPTERGRPPSRGPRSLLPGRHAQAPSGMERRAGPQRPRPSAPPAGLVLRAQSGLRPSAPLNGLNGAPTRAQPRPAAAAPPRGSHESGGGAGASPAPTARARRALIGCRMKAVPRGAGPASAPSPSPAPFLAPPPALEQKTPGPGAVRSGVRTASPVRHESLEFSTCKHDCQLWRVRERAGPRAG